MNIVQQKAGPFWTDETGLQIPLNRVSKSEKLREKRAFQLAKEAIQVNRTLASFKNQVQEICAEVVDAIRAENSIKADGKGNVSWYNFDRSIKVEVNIQEAIKFDDVLIDGAKQKLKELIEKNLTGVDFVKTLVMAAFETSTGKLDTSRVLGLKKYTSKVPANVKTLWDEAMAMIDKSISRPGSKAYQRIWVRNGEGEYESIDLNFSSVKSN